ncbi:hypothetical protein C8A05DRAFT_34269 [Staphylotrichum tortipilum]|uniref:Mitochondrial import inner membrane translocase subunit n=1 Tax=Staphylotrichum tortipilum TaxID=2831512 RepID=A0AAN6RTL6_9PEZI|nr:hypothetical protein C8A05DRAFT_34269 [Staphylotrichum longicolle]
MSSSDFTIDQADLEKLNDKDKAELRQFFSNEEQRARIQAQTHELTAICWKKCISSTSTSASGGGSGGFFRSSSSAAGNNALDKNEQTCLAQCVDRFMDANLATMKHLASLRQQS